MTHPPSPLNKLRIWQKCLTEFARWFVHANLDRSKALDPKGELQMTREEYVTGI